MNNTPITKNMHQALCNYAKGKLNILVDTHDNKKLVVMIDHPSSEVIKQIVQFVGMPDRFYKGQTYSIMYYTVEV